MSARRQYNAKTGVLLRHGELHGLKSYEVFTNGVIRGHVVKRSMGKGWAAVETSSPSYDAYDGLLYAFGTRAEAIKHLATPKDQS